MPDIRGPASPRVLLTLVNDTTGWTGGPDQACAAQVIAGGQSFRRGQHRICHTQACHHAVE